MRAPRPPAPLSMLAALAASVALQELETPQQQEQAAAAAAAGSGRQLQRAYAATYEQLVRCARFTIGTHGPGARISCRASAV